jgi:CopG family transcriptional regulator, nickel-responsive regulator
MQRLTITIDDDLLTEVDDFIAQRGYANRSEAFRDLLRGGLKATDTGAAGDRQCIATVSYVYDHAARELPKRLTKEFHEHKDLAQATLHVHIDQESCLEVTVLRGPGSEVKAFADHVIAERGVRHGQVVMMPVEFGTGHGHGHGARHSHRKKS